MIYTVTAVGDDLYEVVTLAFQSDEPVHIVEKVKEIAKKWLETEDGKERAEDGYLGWDDLTEIPSEFWAKNGLTWIASDDNVVNYYNLPTEG